MTVLEAVLAQAVPYEVAGNAPPQHGGILGTWPVFVILLLVAIALLTGVWRAIFGRHHEEPWDGDVNA